MRYQPQLDGIRGVAVLLVFAYHATTAVPGGWVGVDVFFVISGYLITSLLVSELQRTGTIDVRTFYVKRVLRLGPALVVAVCLSVPLMVAFDAERDYPTWAVVIGVLGYVANWMQVVTPTSLGPLTHTWTLAIEEQFYFVWPFIVLLFVAMRATRRQQIAWLFGAVLAVMGGRILLMVIIGAEATWFATTSRADALLIGALLAIVAPSLTRRAATVVLVMVAVAIGGVALFGREHSVVMVAGGLTGVAVIAAAGVTAAAQSPLGRVLTFAPLVAVGRVSYGIYLYHYPVFYLSNQLHVDGMGAWVVKVVGTAFIVVVSWYGIERPALRLKRRFAGARRGPRPQSI